MTRKLEPITAIEAQTLYLQDKGREAAPSTIRSQKYRLDHFVRWCDEEGIDNLNNLTARDIQRYRNWKREDGDLRPASEKMQMVTLRVFIKYLESIEAYLLTYIKQSTHPLSKMRTLSEAFT